MKKIIVLVVGLLASAGIVAALVTFASGSEDESGHDDSEVTLDPRNEIERDSPIELNPSGGEEIGFVYESYLSPEQEAEEEEDTPEVAPDVFKSTAPSVPREERDSRGHAVLEFTNDLSRAYIHLETENVDPEDIVMLHIHCGRPGQLGPIIVDFGLHGDPAEMMEDERLTFEILNEDLLATIDSGHGLVGAFTAGCPIVQTIPNDRTRTIAGMELIARRGELYFNLHTKGQTFYGDIRGQFYLVEMDS